MRYRREKIIALDSDIYDKALLELERVRESIAILRKASGEMRELFESCLRLVDNLKTLSQIADDQVVEILKSFKVRPPSLG